MTPLKQNTDIRFITGASSLGMVLVALGPEGVAAIMLDADERAVQQAVQACFPTARAGGADDAALAHWLAVVTTCVETPWAMPDLPLEVRGTPFQQQVWQALRGIPCGQTVTYGELAARIGRPGAVRAVAGACAANRLAVVVPCHRVIRHDGSLSGYRWGVERKQALLARERVWRAGGK
ncbi:cysteine methyltransferase [Komagataeibacter nataicola]|uniref:Cysteine methyltransferase n=1 Tax=Komagataeibacter nataicola TaxID=265960 RepID=A0A9N7CPI2_9PROT|nr:methylated-DNA--[protein]-cysteine S-methyltransferase [Komagataeibacter nataicola]AQU86256.1 cysteine methyltransferase [Komagataeibacter nataicola]PYD65467.1 cysteine methyltransferase [Komagataeibacter nataicola]WEQ56880.1 methylated-DNA--[protein]-cysteine S-methyltransferase [Komagataeibacter nataicola]WNM08333.1 methylated-DNA--[protein]-cysteine S-methyltransferase [Komagataeibacter nataicola]